MPKASSRGCARVVAGLCLASLWMCLAPLRAAAAGDEFSPCRTGSLKDLSEAMKAHNEHVYRMNRKFKDIWYFQGALPPGVGQEVGYESLHRFLAQLAPRRAALLFHAMDNGRLCTWLVMPKKGDIVHHLQPLSAAQFEGLSPTQWQDLGVRTVRKPRVADRSQPHVPLDKIESRARWNVLLARIAGLLMPPPVATRLLEDGIDTLIVVPVSIRHFRPGHDEENDSATTMRGPPRDLAPSTQFALAISTVPFLALPLGERQVADTMSVVIAPGFLPFAGDPAPPRERIAAPLVVGAAVGLGIEPLPGAQQEVAQIATDLKTDPIAGQAARKDRVLAELATRAGVLDFILLATHGRASETDPIDRSYLELSGGMLTAREISRLRQDTGAESRLLRHPVVVMSACETGLGKSFAVGTIGLARAWQWAGASSVVMSLWSVDDQATRDLMIDFVGKLRAGRPADRALREAAIDARRLEDNPAFWAAFSVFGVPERERPH